MPAPAAANEMSIFDILPASRAQVVRSPTGSIHIWRPARGLFVTHIEGVMKLDGALAVETNMRRVAAEDGRFRAFHDWAGMTDYETEGRLRLTRAVLDVRKSVEESHLLVSSRLVALGVQAANLVVKILIVHTARPAFQNKLREAIHRRS